MSLAVGTRRPRRRLPLLLEGRLQARCTAWPSATRSPGLGKTHPGNKYYFDWLYTTVIVGFVKGPLARATNWFNQNVLDGVVNGVGKGAVGTGNWVYDNIDQTVVDGAVNGVGITASESGGVLRRLQTGRIQQYAALFFAAAAILAGIFVIVIG